MQIARELALEFRFFFSQFLFRFFFAICCKFQTASHFALGKLSGTTWSTCRVVKKKIEKEEALWVDHSSAFGPKVTNVQRLLFAIDFRHLKGITAGLSPSNPHLNPHS